jgi:hypothetical protein
MAPDAQTRGSRAVFFWMQASDALDPYYQDERGRFGRESADIAASRILGRTL